MAAHLVLLHSAWQQPHQQSGSRLCGDRAAAESATACEALQARGTMLLAVLRLPAPPQ